MTQIKNFNKTSILIMLILIVLGIIIGTAFYTQCPEIVNTMGRFVKTADKRSIITVFSEAFTDTFLILVLLMILGFGSVFQPLEISSLLLHGFILGVSFSHTYTVYAMKGFFISVLMILPHALAVSVILVLAVRESMRMSTSIAVFAFKGDSELIKRPDLSTYFLKFSVLAILLAVSSVIDCVITYLLTGMLII